MDESLSGKILTKIGLAILTLALVDLLFVNWWIVKGQNSNTPLGGRAGKNQNVTSQNPGPASSPVPINSPEPTPATASLLTASSPNPNPSPQVVTQTVVEKQTQTVVQTAQKEIFIPIGSASTFSNNYADLPGLSVSIDTTKYSAIDSVDFEASIWVDGGNGKVSAQIYQSGVGPIFNSQITSSSSQGTLVISPGINLGSGSYTYKVQAKTDLVNFAAHVENARIKIILK